MDKIKDEVYLHALKKISRKIITARELIDECSDELDRVSTLLFIKEELNAKHTD